MIVSIKEQSNAKQCKATSFKRIFNEVLLDEASGFPAARREQEAKTFELKQRLVENNIYAGSDTAKGRKKEISWDQSCQIQNHLGQTSLRKRAEEMQSAFEMCYKLQIVQSTLGSGYGKSELNVEKKRRALSEGAERRELLTDYSRRLDILRHDVCEFPSGAEAKAMSNLSKTKYAELRFPCWRNSRLPWSDKGWFTYAACLVG